MFIPKIGQHSWISSREASRYLTNLTSESVVLFIFFAAASKSGPVIYDNVAQDRYMQRQYYKRKTLPSIYTNTEVIPISSLYGVIFDHMMSICLPIWRVTLEGFSIQALQIKEIILVSLYHENLTFERRNVDFLYPVYFTKVQLSHVLLFATP